MDNSRFPMAKPTEPNPLRPYYIPPSIGTSSSRPPPPHASPPPSYHSPPPPHPPSSSSYTRDLLPDLDLDLASTGNEAWQVTRSLLDTLAWRYTSTLLAQPFDVAKTLLQVSLPLSPPAKETPSSSPPPRRRRRYDTSSDSEATSDDEEMPDYFSQTAATPKIRSDSSRRRKRESPSPSPAASPPPRPRHTNPHNLRLTHHASVMHAISQLYATAGATGLWRATNTTFLYSILVRTTDSFIRSLLLAVLALPDISGPSPTALSPGITTPLAAGFGGVDLSDSPHPLASLVVIAISSGLTGLFLLPLDLVRTRLIVTPLDHSPRGLWQNLQKLPSLLAPSHLWLPTALHHSLPNTFSAWTPLFLRRQLRLTPESSPSLWSLAAFATTLTELFLRLPLETVVRRAHVATLRTSEPDLPLIITPGPYKGVWGTFYSILYLEGETMTKSKDGVLRTRKGQGVHGLVRGWRIGFWGLVGVWGAGALGGEGKGREF